MLEAKLIAIVCMGLAAYAFSRGYCLSRLLRRQYWKKIELWEENTRLKQENSQLRRELGRPA